MDKFVFFGRSYFQYNGFDPMRVLLNDVINDPDFYYAEPTDSKAFNKLNYYYENRIGTAIKKRIGIPRKEAHFKEYMQFYDLLSKTDMIYFLFVRFETWFFGEDGFLAYLKKEFPESKLVYLLINVNKYLNIDFNVFCPYFDRVITIDEGDASKYGLEYHPFFYSAISKEDPSLPKSDCFFIGNAKERLDIILEIYESLIAQGLKCDFHIVNVPDERQRYKDEIVYNQPMNYDDIVCHVKKSRMLLEIMQEGQTSGTLREHEAAIYGKKLLTNNQYIKQRNFYTPDNVLVFSDANDLDIETFNKTECREYPNKDQISPRSLLEYIRKNDA